MDRARGTEGTGGGRKPQRPVWFQWGLLASLLAPLSACAGASPPDPGYAAPPQDSLAAVIRNLRAGEDALAVVDAVAAAARITPEHLDGKLRDAMTHALTLSINAEDNVLADLGSVLEEALGAAWSQEELAATMREIPSEMGLPTPRQRVAARLANRLDAGEADDDLRAAMAETFTSIGGDHYPMHVPMRWRPRGRNTIPRRSLQGSFDRSPPGPNGRSKRPRLMLSTTAAFPTSAVIPDYSRTSGSRVRWGAEGPLATREGRPGRFRGPKTGVSGPKGVVVRLGRAFRRRLETPRRPCGRRGRGRVRRLAVAPLSGGPVQGKPAGEHGAPRRPLSIRRPETVKRPGCGAAFGKAPQAPAGACHTARWTCMIW